MLLAVLNISLKNTVLQQPPNLVTPNPSSKKRLSLQPQGPQQKTNYKTLGWHLWQTTHRLFHGDVLDSLILITFPKPSKVCGVLNLVFEVIVDPLK